MLGRDSWVSDLRTYGNNILIETWVKLTGPETQGRVWDRREKRTMKITSSRGSAEKRGVTTAQEAGAGTAWPEQSLGEGLAGWSCAVTSHRTLQ